MERFSQSAQLHLACLDQAADRADKLVQPPPLIDPLLGAGPAAEFLTIVCQDGQPVTGAAELTQVVRGLLRRAEGDQVAQALIDGKQRNTFTVALRPERSMQLLRREPGDQEMTVVDQRVAHTRSCQIGRKLRFPDALGEPEAASIYAEAAANRLVHPLDLLDPVGAGQRGKHGLIEAGQEQLHPTIAHQLPEEVQVRGVVGLQPLEQWARQMEHERQEASGGEMLQNWTVDVLDMLLEDVIEVADRLMQVETEDEADRGH